LRFTIEALFLALLAAALAVADLEQLVIAGAMAAGWVVVALFEWAAARERPHYGRGLPPRYYVPQVSMPPPRPLEQLRSGYPGADDDTPTWFASPPPVESVGWPASSSVGSRAEDTVAGELLPTGLEPERRADSWLDVDDAGETIHVGGPPERTELDGPASEPVPEQAEAALVDAEIAEDVDRWDDAVDEDEGAAVAAASTGAVGALGGEVEVPVEPTSSAQPDGLPPARHQFDPFEEPAAIRRRRRRKGVVDVAYVEVAAGPPPAVVLPGRSRRPRDEASVET
jgi:hypothetical protein